MPSAESIYGYSVFLNEEYKQQGIYGYTFFPLSVGRDSIFGYVYFPEGCKGYSEKQLTIAEIYQITCTDGSIARFTSHDQDIVYGGNTYQAIPIKRGGITYHTDLQVDKVDITFGLVGIKVGTKEYTIPEIVRRDFLRDANVKVYSIDYVNPLPVKLRFDGFITGDITYNKSLLTLSVGSILDRLNEKFPKLIYSEYCNHKLYDAYCGLNKDTYKQSGTVLVNSTRRKIYANVFLFSNKPQGWWVRGEIKVTNEAAQNYNVSRSILVHGDGYIETMLSFPNNFTPGDTFDIWAGCDRTGVTCATKWLTSNYANFLGFEYIPKPEILVNSLL